jgi:hypothetical protein
VLQHRPSTPWLLAQCDGEPQVAPFACFATQMPAAQNWFVVQSAFVLQGPAH